MQISFVDVKRVHFNAKIDREAAPCFVDLPHEDPEHKDKCAELLKRPLPP